MQTRDALKVYSQGAFDPNAVHGPLAEHGERLLAAHEEREAARMADAQERSLYQGTEATMAALQRVLGERAAENLVDRRLPAIMTYDAYCLMADAAKADPQDRGLKNASLLLGQRWKTEGGMGSLSVGDLEQLRAHIINSYPKSKVAHMVDQVIPKYGFQTLDLQHLVRLASGITDQSSYEQVIINNGLDGAQPEQIRARAFVMAISALGDAEQQPQGQPQAELQGFEDRVHARLAQLHGPPPGGPPMGGPPMGPPPGDGPSGMSPEMSPADDDFEDNYGEEADEEHDTVESPITGEEISIELGVAQSGPMPGDDAEMGRPPDLEGFEPVGQLQDTMSETVVMMEDPTAPGQMLEVSLRPVEEEGVDEGPLEEPTEMGTMEPEELGPPGPPMDEHPGHGPMANLHEAKSPPGRSKQVEKIKKKERAKGESKEKADAVAFGSAWNQYKKEKGKKKKSYVVVAQTTEGTQELERFNATNLTAALARIAAEGIDGQVHINAAKDEAIIAVSTADVETYLHIMGADKKLPGADKGFNPGKINNGDVPVTTYAPKNITPENGAKVLRGRLSQAEVRSIAEVLELNGRQVEARLLNGEELLVSGFRLALNNTDEVEFGRISGRSRIAGLSSLDHVIGDFQAAVAAQTIGTVDESLRASEFSFRPLFQVRCATCGGIDEFVLPDEPASTKCASCGFVTGADTVGHQVTASAKRAATSGQDYVLLIDVPAPIGSSLTPAQKKIRAERVKAAISRVVPNAEFDLDGDSLGITLRQADMRALNAVESMLKSAFGIPEIAAAVLEGMPAAKTALVPQAPGTTTPMPAMQAPMPAVQAPMAAPMAASPFVGKPPENQQPAGQPAQAMNAPMQTANVGSGDQQRMINQHTDPLDPSKMNATVRMGQMGPPPGPDAGPPGGDMGGPPMDGPPGGDMGGPPGGGMGGAPGGAPGGGMGGPTMGQEQPVQLTEEQKTVIYSALRYYHQKQPYAGELALGSQLGRDYGDLLDMIAPEKSPQRRVLERVIGGMINEVLAEPVLVFQGAIPEPGHINTQQPDAVSVSDDLHAESEDDELPGPGSINNGDAPVQSYAPKNPGHLGPDSDSKDMGSFGAPKPPANGHIPPTTYAGNPNHETGPDSMSGENAMTRKMDEVSHAADHALRSARKDAEKNRARRLASSKKRGR